MLAMVAHVEFDAWDTSNGLAATAPLGKHCTSDTLARSLRLFHHAHVA